MATFFEWSDVLSVGIEEIDAQHYAEFFIEAGASPKLKKKSWASRIWNHLQS